MLCYWYPADSIEQKQKNIAGSKKVRYEKNLEKRMNNNNSNNNNTTATSTQSSSGIANNNNNNNNNTPTKQTMEDPGDE